MPTPTLHRDLPQVAKDYDHVVIDGAPRVNELGRAAIMASDLVVVPVQPSPYDVWASADVAGLINEAKQFKERLRAVFTINRKIEIRRLDVTSPVRLQSSASRCSTSCCTSA
jgi:chromosome partitioning protein